MSSIRKRAESTATPPIGFMDNFTLTAAVLAAHRLPLPAEKFTVQRGAGGIYLLAATGTSITIHDQQVRAFNLAWALSETVDEIARERISVAVIGGGFSGMTVAAGLASFGFPVEIFAGQGPAAAFKATAHRKVYPRLFDWPARGWNLMSTSLPSLNWSTDSIISVGEVIQAQFEEISKSKSITKHNTRAKVWKNSTPADIRVEYSTNAGNSKKKVDIVILCPGPGGKPRRCGLPDDGDFDPFLNYWLYVPPPEPTPITLIGFGDGGAQDLYYSIFRDFDYGRVEAALATTDGRRVEKIVRDIELAVHPLDRSRTYANLSSELVIPDLQAWLEDAEYGTVYDKEETIFDCKMTPLNRLLLANVHYKKRVMYDRTEVSSLVSTAEDGNIRFFLPEQDASEGSELQALDGNVLIRAGVEELDWGSLVGSERLAQAAARLQQIEREFPRYNSILRKPLWSLNGDSYGMIQRDRS